MTTTHQQNERASESGNVLFLILIAVALFAALSYAVTQSSRSGSGDAGEKTLVSSSALTQYPAGVRTSIVRMVISGVAVNDLLFDTPETFPDIEGDADPAAMKTRAVFYPAPGGGATSSYAPADTMANGQQGQWIYSSKYQVQNIGSTSTADNSGNDIIAFLPGISRTLCIKLDTQLGIALTSGEPPTESAAIPTTTEAMVYATPGITSTTGIVIGATGALTGQPFGCYKNGTTYIYYHVLVER